MNINLSEKEIRIIAVALRKHFYNMTDNNGEVSGGGTQEFADCCYKTSKRFEELDNRNKKFDELNDLYVVVEHNSRGIGTRDFTFSMSTSDIDTLKKKYGSIRYNIFTGRYNNGLLEIGELIN